jgi:glycosyltransferase involved in cell wall biosynthesis
MIKNSGKLLSVVIPAYNEEEVIAESLNRIHTTLIAKEIDFEIIVCNDGSTDRTLAECMKLVNVMPLRIIELGANAGHMTAIRAGLEASKGDFVVTIDADLQDPPEYIPAMFALMFENSSDNEVDFKLRVPDVIQAFRVDRSLDSFSKRTSAALYYFLIKKLTGISLTPHAADFRIMTRRVVDVLLGLPEGRPVYRLLIPKLGFLIVTFPIKRAERFAGETKYTYRKMFSLALDSIISFTYKPLRIFSYLGFISSFILFALSIFTFAAANLGTTVPGWASIALLILSANAFLFAGMGLLGEYVGRIYELVQARPLVVWKEVEVRKN